MSNMIGKSGLDWGLAIDGATHMTKHGASYKWEDSICYVYGTTGAYWDLSVNDSRWLKDNLISKEEDLEMSKQLKGVKDLKEGVLVLALSGEKGFIKDGCVVWMPWGHSPFSYYSGYTHKRNSELSIVSYSEGKSFSCTYEFIDVKQTESDTKIKELEATIKLAQQQLNELKEIKQ